MMGTTRGRRGNRSLHWRNMYKCNSLSFGTSAPGIGVGAHVHSRIDGIHIAVLCTLSHVTCSVLGIHSCLTVYHALRCIELLYIGSLFPVLVRLDTESLLNLELLLHLIVETGNTPSLIASVDILPGNHILTALEDLLVEAGEATSEGHGPPLAIADDLELHAAANRLGDTKGASQGLHAQGLLSSLPVLEAGLEGMGRNGCVGLGVVGVDADAVAEGVVNAGRGRRR